MEKQEILTQRGKSKKDSPKIVHLHNVYANPHLSDHTNKVSPSSEAPKSLCIKPRAKFRLH